LSAGEPVLLYTARFELGMLHLLGQLPSLATCVECGDAVSLSGRVAFGQSDGGVLCSRCREGKKEVASVSAGVLRLMQQLAEPESRTWRRLEIDPRSRGELRGVLNRYLVHVLGRKPRMYQYLGLLTT
jgi:recombinational DNA repair protein (RecF pathway)